MPTEHRYRDEDRRERGRRSEDDARFERGGMSTGGYRGEPDEWETEEGYGRSGDRRMPRSFRGYDDRGISEYTRGMSHNTDQFGAYDERGEQQRGSYGRREPSGYRGGHGMERGYERGHDRDYERGGPERGGHGYARGVQRGFRGYDDRGEDFRFQRDRDYDRGQPRDDRWGRERPGLGGERTWGGDRGGYGGGRFGGDEERAYGQYGHYGESERTGYRGRGGWGAGQSGYGSGHASFDEQYGAGEQRRFSSEQDWRREAMGYGGYALDESYGRGRSGYGSARYRDEEDDERERFPRRRG